MIRGLAVLGCAPLLASCATAPAPQPQAAAIYLGDGDVRAADCSTDDYLCGYIGGLRFSLPRVCTEEVLRSGWTGAGVEMRFVEEGFAPLTIHGRSGRWFAYESMSPERAYFYVWPPGSYNAYGEWRQRNGEVSLDTLVPSRPEDYGRSGLRRNVRVDGGYIACAFE